MKKVIQSKLIICLILLIAVLLNSCGLAENKEPMGSSHNSVDKDSNLFLKYYAIEDNGAYYYVEENIIYRNFGGEVKSIVNESKNIFLIGIADKELYYQSGGENGNNFEVYKYNLDKNKKTLIINSAKEKELSNEYLHNIKLCGDKLLIQMSYEFFILNIDTKKLSKCENDVRQFQVVDNDMYFTDGNSDLYKLDLENKLKQIILKSDTDINCTDFLVIDNDVYFYSHKSNELYLKNADGNTCIANGEIDGSSLFNYNGTLYYIAEENSENYLFTYDKQNNKTQKVTSCKDYSTGLEIIDDCVIYTDSKEELVYKSI